MLKSSLRGIPSRRGRQDFLYGMLGSYNKTVLATNPIAYWPQSETSGVVAECLVNSAQNGTQSSDVSTRGAFDTDGPFGMSAPFYDGTNDVCNIYSATLNAAFSAATGTVLLWAKVTNVGVWTDGTTRRPLYLSVDPDNRINLEKTAAANQLGYRYEANTVQEWVPQTLSPTIWVCFGITWSTAADEMRAYYQGVQQGLTQNGLGVWVGNLLNTGTVIGATNTGAGSSWSGWLGPCAIWDRALPLATIETLALV